MPTTLADRLAQRDAERFIGRAAELALFETLFDSDAGPCVVLVHGPGGIGKSMLLRELARRAERRGWSPWLVDARELAPVPGELESVFGAARRDERPIVLLDTYELAAALGGLLRQELVPALPERSIVVLAGRAPPEHEWFTDGWEHVTRSLQLHAFTAAEGHALVEAMGVAGGRTADALVHWSDGSPLALTLATQVAQLEGGWDGRAFEQRPELVDLLVRRLIGAQVEDEHADVTAVAAIARTTTAAMLADVLPTTESGAAYRWLRRQAIAEPVGEGVAMHELVRRVVRAHLLLTRPERARELRRRIADHLFARACAGEPRLMVDLAELIENPALRWGFGAERAAELHADTLRPGELDDLPPNVRARGSDAWWETTGALADASPEHFVVARDAHQTLRGLAVAFTPDNASPAAEADPYVGGWIRHAREHAPGRNALVWRDSLDLAASERGDLSSRVLAIVNTAAVLRSGLVNPRLIYLPINPLNAASVAFAEDSGSRHLPELDVDVGAIRHECHVVDYGPDGLLGSQRNTIYAELGLPRPRAAERPAAITAADIRRALRNLDRPSELAVSPLASALGAADPAAAVRASLVEAASRAFGSGSEEALLRDLVARAYVDRRTSHEQIAGELHMSRSTYFRRLRQATARVADYMLATLDPPE